MHTCAKVVRNANNERFGGLQYWGDIEILSTLITIFSNFRLIDLSL